MDIDLKEKDVSASVNNKAEASDVTNDDVMNLEGVTDVDVEDVLVETEDENNMNVREVLELEDEMAQDDMNTKRKDVFEETAEVENNVSDVQEQEMVKSNMS